VEPVTVTRIPTSDVEILIAHEDLVVTRTRYAAEERGPDFHVHRKHADAFYVLDGAFTIALRDGERVLEPGTFALVPPNVVHAFRNDGPGDMRFLNFHAPGTGFDRYLLELRDAAPESRAAISAGFDQHPAPADGGLDPGSVLMSTGEYLAECPSLNITLLADDGQLGISHSWSAPGGPSPPAHLHRRHSESFYVLEGEMTFTVDGLDVQAKAGSMVHVPPGVVHTFAFSDSAEVRFLDIHAPSSGFGDFLRALHAARDEEELSAARARFDQAPAP